MNVLHTSYDCIVNHVIYTPVSTSGHLSVFKPLYLYLSWFIKCSLFFCAQLKQHTSSLNIHWNVPFWTVLMSSTYWSWTYISGSCDLAFSVTPYLHVYLIYSYYDKAPYGHSNNESRPKVSLLAEVGGIRYNTLVGTFE